jgi:hypothetical protein
MSTSRQKNDPYDGSSYDQYFCLKAPPLLWVALVYLSRAITVPLVVALSSLGGGSSDTREFMRGAISAATLFPSLIAALVLYALIRRTPAGPEWVRWVWARGRALLALSAATDLLVTVGSSLWHWGLGAAQSDAVALITGAFDAYFLIYLLASKRLRDTFRDFPAAERALSK